MGGLGELQRPGEPRRTARTTKVDTEYNTNDDAPERGGTTTTYDFIFCIIEHG